MKTIDKVHADTQGRSEAVFGLSPFLAIQLMSRMRTWNDVTFYRPDPNFRCRHIDKLFTETVNWDLIEKAGQVKSWRGWSICSGIPALTAATTPFRGKRDTGASCIAHANNYAPKQDIIWLYIRMDMPDPNSITCIS